MARLLSALAHFYWRWRLRNVPRPAEFDAEWYCRRYPDVASADVDPLLHFLRFGRAEERDPSPNFSTSGYAYSAPDAAPLPELPGNQPFRTGQLTLMVCAHQVGHQLYGAERSLLDVLDSLNQLEVNLLVTLPSAINREYVEQVRKRAWQLAIVPYGWWRAGQVPVAATLGHFQALLQRYSVDALYANTLVLDEPLAAAGRLDVPRLVHVRELPDHDPALCEILGATPDEIRARVCASADIPLTNSAFTAHTLGLDAAIVVPNRIDVAGFEGIASAHSRGEPVTLGMISSNIPKKGLDDFVALAGVLESAAPAVRCRLIGPENRYIQALRTQKARGKVPANLDFAGYAPSPQQALAQLDILVNLSHFEESFGRTVLEAMAAGRPVIAYHWGALPELIVQGETGYLVPLGDVHAVADVVASMATNVAVRRRLGEAGQRRAIDYYGADMMRTALAAALHKINKH